MSRLAQERLWPEAQDNQCQLVLTILMPGGQEADILNWGEAFFSVNREILTLDKLVNDDQEFFSFDKLNGKYKLLSSAE